MKNISEFCPQGMESCHLAAAKRLELWSLNVNFFFEEPHLLTNSLIIIGPFKVSARVKKGKFSTFLISRCSDKAFQELSFKKKFHKKIFFQCKVIGR